MARFDNFGQALRELRLERGWQQVDLARLANVTPALLSSYETGRKAPSLTNLGKILDALGVRLEELEDRLDRVNDRDPAGPLPVQRARAVPGVNLKRFLGRETLPAQLETAFAEMVLGFQRIARHLCDQQFEGKPPRQR